MTTPSGMDGGGAWEANFRTCGLITSQTLDGLLVLPSFLQKLYPFLLVVAQLCFQKLNLDKKVKFTRHGLGADWTLTFLSSSLMVLL